MKKFWTSMVAATVLAGGIVASVSGPASADSRYYRHRGGYDRHYGGHHDDTGAILGAGAIGLAAGALIGGSLANSNSDVINEGPVQYRRSVPVRSYRGYDHVSACAARYRSYDSRSDTFIGNDGYEHACRL